MPAGAHIAALLLACASLTVATVAPALEPDKIFEKVSASVWTVRALDAQEKPISIGSAVVVGPGRLITNCHVLRQARSIQIRRDNISHAATLEFPDTERDLCQITVRNLFAPALVIAPAATLKVGQRVYAIGSPQGLELTLSDGLISSLRGGEGGPPLIQTSAPISPGSSGGGLFDSEGRLIGITSFQRKDSQNLNFAIPADWISEVPARGQAALDKRREAAATVASAPATSVAPPPPATPAGDYPKQVTGETFAKFFQENRVIRGTSGSGKPLRLELHNWYADGYTEGNEPGYQNNTLAVAPSARGKQSIRTADNQVCFDFSLSQGMFWKGHSGCYQLVETGPREYLLKPMRNETDFRFNL
jgi:S1-C subfamily serine protease